MPVLKQKHSVRTYEFFGVEIPDDPNGSNQYVTTCPFCSRTGHFYIDGESLQSQCKDSNCGFGGNVYTFLTRVFDTAYEGTTPNAHKRLSECRKRFPRNAYIQARVGWSSDLECWLLPVRNREGRLTNLLKYSGEGPWLGSPGCSQHLYGLERVKEDGPIYVTEGQWDAMALSWLLRGALPSEASWSVLGAPGATTMPKADLEVFRGRDVVLLYDNDEAGQNGVKHVVGKLDNIAGSIKILIWPEGTPDKTDLEDFIRTSTDRPKTTLENLLNNCFLYQPGADPTEKVPELVRTSIDQIYDDFRETGIYMYDGLKDCLVLSLATVLASRMEGEPLWMYMIGDPGRGKSLVLESTLGSRYCTYRTSITHKAFVSGIRVEGEDRSLLSILPGRALVVKDYSNVLSLPFMEQDQLVSLLREAYDGRIIRSYGNQVIREYPPPDSPFKDCRFSFVAGVTKEIHARSHAGLGERFLKYEIPCTDDDNRQAMIAALDDTWKSHERQTHRSAAVRAFLDNHIQMGEMPIISSGFKNKIMALAEFVGLCRSPVSRSKGDLDFAPSPESGTRVAKQLRKLAQCVSLVLGLDTANGEVYRLVRKVAWDTAHAWRRDIYRHLMLIDGAEGTNKVSSETGLSLGTTHRQLHDMLALKMVERKTFEGQLQWRLAPGTKKIYSAAKLEEV